MTEKTSQGFDTDVVIIGGGINGSGIARDCALRKLSCVLLEKNDICGATTGWSSGMIHGGVRYLTYDRSVTYHSCLDSGYIQKIAPHLIFRIPFLFPLIDTGRAASYTFEAAEAFFRAYDKFSPLKGGKPHGRLSARAARTVEPGLTQKTRGAITFDEWGIDTFRLTFLNALQAAEHGADIRTGARVEELLIESSPPRVVGVRYRDTKTGEVHEVRGRMVVNATGPWAPTVCRMAGVDYRLRPAKGVHLVFERRFTSQAILCKTIDGRGVFIQPHENETWLGTTDDDYYGDPGKPEITYSDVEYLLQAAERVFPAIRSYRLTRAFCGVRPTLYEWGPLEDELSRNHDIVDHETRHGMAGFVTLAGGKLAAYRLMAEETVDCICEHLDHDAPCLTHRVPLPGGDEIPDATEVGREYEIHPYAASRLIARHGSLVHEVLADIKADGSQRRVIDPFEPVLEAEVRWAARNEWVDDLSALRRRCRVGLGQGGDIGSALRAGRILAQELDWAPERVMEETRRFLDARWERRRVVLRGRQLAREEAERWRLLRQLDGSRTVVGVAGKGTT